MNRWGTRGATTVLGIVMATALAIPAQAGFKPFDNYPAGTETLDVLAADFNRDGHQDLVASNRGTDTITVLRGRGNGKFKTPFDVSTGSGPLGLDAADFTGDRRPDLAVADQNTGGGIDVLKALRSGGFKTPKHIDSTSSYSYVVAAKLVGDKHLDLAASADDDDLIDVFPGKGNGKFGAPQHLSAPDSPFGLASGDIDGDHRADLAYTSDGGIGVLLSKRSGGFSGPHTYPAGVGPNDVEIGRVDANRKRDLVVADYSTGKVWVLRGKGNGELRKAKGYNAVGSDGSAAAVKILDYDGNRYPGLAVVDASNDGKVSLLRGKRKGFGKPSSSKTGPSPYGMTVGRFNGDKHPDIAASSYEDELGNGSISVLLSK